MSKTYEKWTELFPMPPEEGDDLPIDRKKFDPLSKTVSMGIFNKIHSESQLDVNDVDV